MFRYLAALLLIFGLAQTAAAKESWVGLNVRGQIVYFETNKLNTLNWGLGGEGSFFPHKRLLLEGRYSTSNFINETKSDYKDYWQKDAPTTIKPFTYWEAGGQLNLICKSGEYENSSYRNDSTSSKDYGNKTVYTTYYTKHTWLASEYQLYGIRAGYFELNSGIGADIGEDDDTIKYANGTLVDPNNKDLYYTNYKMTGFYVGIAKTRVYYKEGLWRTFYIDVLFKSKSEFNDPTMSGFTEHKYGARIGMEGARRNVGGRVEGGYRPGLDKLFIVTQLSIGFMI